MQDGGGDPGFWVPTGRRHGKRGTCKDLSRTRCKHEHLIQHTCIRSRASSRGYTFEACLSERIKFVEGSSGARAVVVHGSSAMVVVHGRRGTWRIRGLRMSRYLANLRSRTCSRRHLCGVVELGASKGYLTGPRSPAVVVLAVTCSRT